jgi:hypothetical protein
MPKSIKILESAENKNYIVTEDHRANEDEEISVMKNSIVLGNE